MLFSRNDLHVYDYTRELRKIHGLWRVNDSKDDNAVEIIACEVMA